MADPRMSLEELAAAIGRLTPEERRRLMTLVPGPGELTVDPDLGRLLDIIGVGESGRDDGSTQHDRDLYGGA